MQEEHEIFMGSMTDKYFCEAHLLDDGLIKFFRSGHCLVDSDNECSYCCSIEPTMEVSDLQEYLRTVMGHSYNSAENELPYCTREGGWQGKTYEAHEILESICESCIEESLYNDLHEACMMDCGAYCDYDWASARPLQKWQSGWDEFKDTFKHNFRFFFGMIPDLNHDRNHDEISPMDFPSYFNTAIEKLEGVSKVLSGTPLFRCRVMDIGDSASGFDDITAPPSKFCKFPNRFSPSGISMLYLGEDLAVSKLEIDCKPEINKKLLYGEFRTLHDIALLDLTSLKWPSGCLDPDWIGQYHISRFFQDMIKDMTAPVEKDGREHIDYIPTQVVREYLKYFREDIEGICFSSSKDLSKKSYVFFMSGQEAKDHFELTSLKEERFTPSTTTIL